MGAFADIFKGKADKRKREQQSASAKEQLDWTSTTGSPHRPSRPHIGPRAPSSRPYTDEGSPTNAAGTRVSVEEGRVAALMQKHRRRSADRMEMIAKRMSSVEIARQEKRELPSTPPRRPPDYAPAHPPTHARTYSTPMTITSTVLPHRPSFAHSKSEQIAVSPKRSLPLTPSNEAALRPAPPSRLSTSPVRPSLYPQALPSPPRQLPPVLRGPNPVRQIMHSAPPSSPATPASVYSPMFPGAFPQSRNVSSSSNFVIQPEAPLVTPEYYGGARVDQLPGGVPSISYPTSSGQVTPPRPPQYSPPVPLASRPASLASSPAKSARSAFSPFITSSAYATDVESISSLPYRNSPNIDTPASTPPTPSSIGLGSPATTKQCHGTTGAGKRCTRSAASASPSNSPSKKGQAKSQGIEQAQAMLHDDGGVVRFCFQHAKQAMSERGCFVDSREGRGKWIEFDDWIFSDLPVPTRLALRHEMAAPVSMSDQEGYIYVHELVETKTAARTEEIAPTTYLKIGRSVQPVTRLSQWRGQCPSRKPVVRGIFPQPTTIGISRGGVGLSGALRVADRGLRNHHRWERLVLIEVAGRAEQTASSDKGLSRRECIDCGKVHLELFEVPLGAYEDWVREIVERWGRWCADVLG